MKMKHTICGILCVALCAAMMTACGADSDSKADDTASGNSAQSSELTENGADESDAGDSAAAQAVLERFLAAAADGDRDTIFETSNIDQLVNATITMEASQSEEPLSDEEKEQLKDEIWSELFDSTFQGAPENLKDFVIEPAVIPKAFITYYNGAISDEIESLREDLSGDENSDELVAAFEKMMAPIDAMYSFNVRSNSDPDDEADIYVRLTDDGWKVDIITLAMIGYINKSVTVTANAGAKTIYNATMSVLADMDAMGTDLSAYAGEYTFTGADLIDPPKADDGKEALIYRISLYYSDASALDNIMISVEDGLCTAVAVEMTDKIIDPDTDELTSVFGTYPNQNYSSEQNTFSSLEEAFAFAAES